MQRRNFIRNSVFTAGGLLLTQQQLLANLLQQPAWKIRMLTDDIGIFTERGGTILFYLSKDGIVVVDSQFPDQSKHLIDELKKDHPEPFALLINTHHHGDHSGGNISFKGLVQRVLGHENTLKNMKNVAAAQKSEDKQFFPTETYTKSWSQKHGKEKISLHYFGLAHTDGDSFIHFENANIVHTGDLLFNRRSPFVDRSAGASIKSWIEVLGNAQKKFDNKTKFVYGHSAEGYDITGTREDLGKFAEFLDNILKFTEGEIKAGKTKEEVSKLTAVTFTTEWKMDGIGRPLTAAYEELTASR